MPTRRNRKNGRFTKSSTRRRTKSTNLLDVTQSLIIANFLTKGLANADLMHFITGRNNGKYVAGADGSATLSIPELIRGVNVSSAYGSNVGSGAVDIVMDNFKQNGLQMVAGVLLTPIVFSMAKKVLRKPVLTPTNRMLKQVGITGVKV